MGLVTKEIASTPCLERENSVTFCFLRRFYLHYFNPKGEILSPYPKAIAFIILTMVSARSNPSALEAFPAKTVPDLQKYFSSANASH